MKRWITAAAVVLLLSLTLCACGKKAPEKNYDVIGNMSFSDTSILTLEEKETLSEMKARKEQLLEAKDEEGLAALKAEWEAFSAPIKSYISKYDTEKRSFFSTSDKALLTPEEASRCSELEAQLTAAYRTRNVTELNAAIGEWKTYSAPLREWVDLYHSIERPDFSQEEMGLMNYAQKARLEELNDATDAALESRDADALRSLKSEWSDFSREIKSLKKDYVTVPMFSVKGKWKNTGANTFGQVQQGAIVVFDDTHCNVYSPQDTYAFYKDGNNYRLDCTSFLFAETLSFTVKLVDRDHMDIFAGSGILELTRVE